MSLVSKQRQFLSPSEQQVLAALEVMTSVSARLPSPQQVQKRMRQMGLKKLAPFRIGQIIRSLEIKGRIERSISIVKQKQAVA